MALLQHWHATVASLVLESRPYQRWQVPGVLCLAAVHLIIIIERGPIRATPVRSIFIIYFIYLLNIIILIVIWMHNITNLWFILINGTRIYIWLQAQWIIFLGVWTTGHGVSALLVLLDASVAVGHLWSYLILLNLGIIVSIIFTLITEMINSILQILLKGIALLFKKIQHKITCVVCVQAVLVPCRAWNLLALD